MNDDTLLYRVINPDKLFQADKICFFSVLPFREDGSRSGGGFRRRSILGPRIGLADSVAGSGSVVARGDFAGPAVGSGATVGY